MATQFVKLVLCRHFPQRPRTFFLKKGSAFLPTDFDFLTERAWQDLEDSSSDED